MEPHDAAEGAPAAGAMSAVHTVFESLGRALVCLGRDFRVVHASDGLDGILGPGAAAAAVGVEAERLLGAELFGSGASLRKALEAGERREGWGATVAVGDRAPRLVSLTASPLVRPPDSACDDRVAYLVVLRPPAESGVTGGGSPTIFAGMVARSPAMLAIFSLIEKLEESDATILISGESGTGKELVARAVHRHSPCRHGPFVAVNCGALPDQLLESELFGHVKGAFTGAIRDRVGRFELADEGTLFLDEVGEMPPPLQVKLLRVLQERTFERVGESRSRRTGARIVAATNADLRTAALEGGFREDLYYRLRVVPISVPPLRHRREDIEPIARHLLERIAGRYGRSLLLSPEALRVLVRHDWPGNVRELENALEFATAVCQGQTIHPHDLPEEISGAAPSAPPRAAEAPATPAGATADPAAERERRRLLEALEAHRWRRAPAARALGVSRTTLWRRMRELGLSEPSGAD